MKQFIFRYFFWLLLLFTLLYWPQNPVALWLNELQRQLTLAGLAPFLNPGQLQGIDIIINPHYKIIITQACNGVIPVLFLWAGILAFPAPLWYRFLWLLIGYVGFSIVNVVRLLMVVHFVEKGGQPSFYWAHDILGNGLLILFGQLLFMLYLRGSRRFRKY
jgi:exosortase/archaeosortase family protein